MSKLKRGIVIIQPWISYGGAEAVSVQLAYNLQKVGYSVKVLAIYKDDKLPYLGSYVKIVTSGKLGFLISKNRYALLVLGLPILLFLALREVKRGDIVNPHNFPSLWVAGVIRILYGNTVIWTCHNFPQTPFFSRTLNFPIEAINRFFVGRANAVVATSEKVARAILKKYSTKAEVIYPAIAYDYYSKGTSRAVRESLKLKEKDFLILCVGRLKREKSFDLALNSLARIAKKNKHLKMAIVGDGPEIQRLTILAKRLELAARIIFVGYQEPHKMRNYYAACNLVFLPSYKTEGFNLVPFEALCQAKPSLVAKGSGADEVLAREGIGFVSKPDITTFSKTLNELAENPYRLGNTGEKGRAWVKSHLSWETYTRKFRRLI